MTKKRAPKTYSHVELVAHLATKYSAPAWAFLPEVPDGTGATHRRTIDGLAMSLYPSKGLELHAFEVKATRADLLRELRSPEKADAWIGTVDYWWICANKGVVAGIDELPDLWGLLEPTGGGLRIVKPARQYPDASPDRPLLASIFRQVHRAATTEPEIERARHQGYSHGVKEGRKWQQREHAQLEVDAQRLRRFESALGRTLEAGRWNGVDPLEVAALVRRILDGDREAERARKRIHHTLQTVEKIAETLRSLTGEDSGRHGSG